MKTALRPIPALLLMGGLLAAPAHAEALLDCHTSDVRITQVTQYASLLPNATAQTIYAGPAVNASACAGAFSGNDGFYPTTNLGYTGDGLLNGGLQVSSGAQLFPNGAFISDAYPLQDLDRNGFVNDPGWVMLGTYANGGFTPSTVGGKTGIVLDTFFSATETGAGTGSWSFTPDAAVAQRLASTFGRNYFDQFAMVFKAGDSFAAYDFTPEPFGATAPSPTDPIMNWYGTYDVSGTLRTGGQEAFKNAAGLSHITLWARDPAPAAAVPEPSSLALLGLAGAALLHARRRTAG